MHPRPHTNIKAGHRWTVLLLVLYCLFPAARTQGQTVDWTLRTTSGPSARFSASMTFDSQRGMALLFGGVAGAQGDTWEWDGLNWNLRTTNAPSGRESTAMAYDSARGQIVLFGGRVGGNPNPYTGDTWEWNGSTWNQRLVLGPSPRDTHAMAYDSNRGVTVLFGGETWPGTYPNTLNGETWEWNGTSWTQRVVTGPSRRASAAMAYDQLRGVTVLFGGDTGAPYTQGAETWEWNGTAWTLLSTGGIPPRSAHAMAYDTARSVSVLFGGVTSNGNISNQTWTLCISPTISTQPESLQTVCQNTTATFHTASTDQGTLTYRWQIESSPLSSNTWTDLTDGNVQQGATTVGTATGTSSSTLSFNHGTASFSPLRFRCVLTNACAASTTQPAQLNTGYADVGVVGGVPGHDGLYDNNDFIVFIAYLITQNPIADLGSTGGVIGPDGQYDNNDLVVYIDRFFQGC